MTTVGQGVRAPQFATPGDLAAMDHRQLREECASRILAAAVMNGSRFANEYHARLDDAYNECHHRGRPSIYAHAWNDVAREQGHEPIPVDPDPEQSAC